uniref:Uncharacterized protein n=1 Tax=Romanomermis culicivorax TaxID=13658 RepID=A0A915J8M9_ROMCU
SLCVASYRNPTLGVYPVAVDRETPVATPRNVLIPSPADSHLPTLHAELLSDYRTRFPAVRRTHALTLEPIAQCRDRALIIYLKKTQNIQKSTVKSKTSKKQYHQLIFGCVRNNVGCNFGALKIGHIFRKKSGEQSAAE